MKTGREILIKWVNDFYHITLDTPYKGGTVETVMLTEPDHIGLMAMIDEALREARQEGIDGKNQNTVMKDAGEHGPYWKEFYLKGCLDLPGVAEAFECKRDEQFWRTQWQEVIRVKFGKPTLRAVDPIEFMQSMECGMSERDWNELNRMHHLIIEELAGLAAVRESAPAGDGVYRNPWE